MNGVNGLFFNNNSPKNLAGTYSDANPGNAYLLVDNALYLGTAGTGVSQSTAGLAEGPHTFSVVAVDLAGNRTASAPAKTFTIDNTAPVVAVTSPQSGTTAAVGTQVIGSITDVNPSPNVANVYFSYNGVRDNNPVTLDATNRVVTSFIPASALGAGTTITLTATDKAGNTATSLPITVNITSPTTGLSDIDTIVFNPADGSPLTRHNTLPAPRTYLRGVFQAFGSISSIVNGVALKSWTLNLVSVADLANPAAVPVLTIGSGTTAQNAALLGSANSASITDGLYYIRLDLTDVNNATTVGTTANGGAAAVTVDNTAPAITNADVGNIARNVLQ